MNLDAGGTIKFSNSLTIISEKLRCNKQPNNGALKAVKIICDNRCVV